MRFKNNVLPLLLGLFALALFTACSQESSTEDGETKQAIKADLNFSSRLAIAEKNTPLNLDFS